MAIYGIGQRHRGSGLTMPGIIGEAVTRGAAVYMSSADGLWYLADADAVATLPVVGVAAEASSVVGRVIDIVVIGIIGRSDWAWTRGDPIYVSGTPGVLTQVAPANLQGVAIALTSTLIYVNPGAAGASASCGLLEGSTAYVGFDACKEPFTNYFYCDGVADNVQISLAEVYVTALGGGTVELERGTFAIVDPIVPTGNQVWFKGQGADTFLDGDGLATGEHIFHVTGRTEFRVSDMRMQTQGGGTKTCHCVFIEDGSNDFHIQHIIIDDSDDNGIHIEGTTITGGTVKWCHINSTDGHGIYVNMDDGNSAYRLKIDGNDIVDVGNAGIYLDASSGNDYCTIKRNNIVNPAGIGIYVNDFNYGQITGNLCTLAGLSGIHVVGSDEVNVADNTCTANERHGIFFTGSTDDSLIDGNTCNDNDSGASATYDGINIDSACTRNTVINNTCLRNNRTGIYVIGASNQININLVAENGEDGIRVSGGDAQVNSNQVDDNSQNAAATHHGIHMMGSGDRAIVMGNHIDGKGDSQEDGIHLSNGATEVTITGNHCQDGMGSGIALEANNDDCSIMGNFLYINDDYGVEISAASCDDNDVMNNTFVGNVTAPVLNSGTNTKFQTKQYYVARDDDNVGDVPGKSITNGQTAYIAVHCPVGAQQIMGFNIYVIPNATKAAANWDLDTDYGANGEAFNTHSENEAAATYNVVNNQWFALDAFAAGMFASMVEEDTGGISLTVSGVGDNVTVVMGEMYYV